MLTDFFRINLPYGLARNGKNRWMAFNRENKPIGFIECDNEVKIHHSIPVYSTYLQLTNRFIQELTGFDETHVERDKKGNICRFWLYNDSTNPINQPSSDNEFWDLYWKKLKELSKLKTVEL